ncbi:MAG TPA: hypothetical protein DDY13_13745 [Cytophagales bacterium]|nr:hypothetical protein [Cytophagales bacterium]
MMGNIVLLFLIWSHGFFLVWGHGITTQPDAVKLTSKHKLKDLNQSVQFWVDSSNNATPENIKEFDQRFRAYTGVPKFNGKYENVWFRFTYTSFIDEKLFLWLNNRWLDHIEIFYVPHQQGGLILLEKTGHAELATALNNSTLRYLIQLPDASGPTTIYGKIKNDNISTPFWVPLKIGTYRTFIQTYQYSMVLSIGAIGIILAMLLYNAMLLITIRDKVYFYYIVYILSALIFVIYRTGYGNGFLKDALWRNSHWPVGIFFTCLLLFIINLFEVRQWNKWMLKLSYPVFFLCILFVLEIFPNSAIVYYLMSILVLGYILYCILYLIFKKSSLGTSSLVAWLPMLITGILYMFMVSGHFFNEFIETHSVELSICWQLIVFSLIIGNRYNALKEEKIQIQQRNLEIVENQNKVLEETVAQRTKIISDRNQELHIKQQKIRDQTKLLQNQNKELYESREIIAKHNKRLETEVAYRTAALSKSIQSLNKQYLQLEQFSYIAAHNLRAPVARILGLTSLFDKKSTSRDNIHIIGELANAASDLDGVIKDMGKIIEAQKISEIPKEEIEFKPFVKNIIERLISKQTQHIKWKINSNTDRITTIKPYLDNILTNIISNSIKYQSPIRKPWIDIQLRAKEEEHCIIVKDNGMGFDQKKLDSKLFVPFQRFNIDKPGKGLGLYLIKTHVEAMNGTVQIESQVNNGTKVTVQLPVNQLNN